jgi:hypothetical protein
LRRAKEETEGKESMKRGRGGGGEGKRRGAD